MVIDVVPGKIAKVSRKQPKQNCQLKWALVATRAEHSRSSPFYAIFRSNAKGVRTFGLTINHVTPWFSRFRRSDGGYDSESALVACIELGLLNVVQSDKFIERFLIGGFVHLSCLLGISLVEIVP